MSSKLEKRMRYIGRNIKLAGAEQKGDKEICIDFADNSSITTKQMSWWFCYKLYQRCCKKYGLDIQKWPKYFWQEKK